MKPPQLGSIGPPKEKINFYILFWVGSGAGHVGGQYGSPGPPMAKWIKNEFRPQQSESPTKQFDIMLL